jgi:hypothetical protein
MSSVSLATVLGLQMATWLFGLPSIRDRDATRVIEAWKSAWRHRPAEEAFDFRQPYPHFSMPFAMPIAPGIIVAYQEDTIDNLGGWNAWTVDFWYGFGATRLGTWITGNRWNE